MYMYYFDTNKNNLKIKHCPCSQVNHNFVYISEISVFTTFENLININVISYHLTL